MKATKLTKKSKPRLRRVTRVIRDVDVWSVFKLGLCLNLVFSLITIVSFVLLWSLGSTTGTIDNVERFLESYGWEIFEFDGRAIFRHTISLFVVLSLFGTAVLVILAITINLLSELVGGLRVTVLEEEILVDETESE